MMPIIKHDRSAECQGSDRSHAPVHRFRHLRPLSQRDECNAAEQHKNSGGKCRVRCNPARGNWAMRPFLRIDLAVERIIEIHAGDVEK